MGVLVLAGRYHRLEERGLPDGALQGDGDGGVLVLLGEGVQLDSEGGREG